MFSCSLSDPTHVWGFLLECSIFTADTQKNMQQVMRRAPLVGEKWEAEGKLPCSAEVALDFGSVASTAAEMRQSLRSSTRALEVSLQSSIVCRALLTSFSTCPSARLSNGGAFIGVPNSHWRGLLMLILQELVKNSNGVTRLGRKAVRDLTENC